MTRVSKTGQDAACHCIALIKQHKALAEGEATLLAAIENDIRVAFDLEGAVHPVQVVNGSPPEVWFW